MQLQAGESFDRARWTEVARQRGHALDTKTAITVACISLVGVLVGGIITAGSNWILAVRRERTEYWIDRHNHDIEVRRASRLIDRELAIAGAVVSYCMENKQWWRRSVDDMHVKTEDWEKYKDVVASELSDTDWLTVATAFLAVANLLVLVGNLDQTSEISDEFEKQMPPILRDIQKGSHALASHTVSRRPNG